MANVNATAETQPDAAPILHGEHLVAGYSKDIYILRDLSIEAWRGQISCVVGPNGTGKSTLLKALFGFLEPVSGTVTLDGEDITGTPPYDMIGKGVAYLPQRPSLFPFLSVKANLMLCIRHMRLAKSEARARLDSVYERFPVVHEKRRQPARELSGGQQRQVEIGRSLMADPHLYLIDEPTAGIDPRTSESIYEIVQGLAHDLGKAIVLVDQDIRSALAIADHVCVVKNGAAVASGPRASFGEDTDALVAQWLYASGE